MTLVFLHVMHSRQKLKQHRVTLKAKQTLICILKAHSSPRHVTVVSRATAVSDV